MNRNLTDVTVIVDRSGSMVDICSDAEWGINALIDKQKTDPGETIFSLWQFDDKYDCVHNAVPAANVPHYKLEPRNMTALNDAVARTIISTGDRLSKMPEDQRPGLVIITIVTDGLENSSVEYKGPAGTARVRKMIEHQKEKYNWQFNFIGAENAFAEAAKLGIGHDETLSFNPQHVAGAYGSITSNMTRMKASSIGGQCCANAYSAEERLAADPAANQATMGNANAASIHIAATVYGRAGGLVGGPARAKSLSAARRAEIAKNAAKTRWANRP